MIEFKPDTPAKHIEDPRSAIHDAFLQAHVFLTNNGYPAAEVHRMSVCYEAAAFVVGYLSDKNMSATHEVRTGPTVAEHSYVALHDGPVQIIGDGTWQQFLPDGAPSDAPKILVGTRSEVISEAKPYGLSDEILELWRADTATLTVEERKNADTAARYATDQTAADGAWERFMTGSTHNV